MGSLRSVVNQNYVASGIFLKLSGMHLYIQVSKNPVSTSVLVLQAVKPRHQEHTSLCLKMPQSRPLSSDFRSGFLCPRVTSEDFESILKMTC